MLDLSALRPEFAAVVEQVLADLRGQGLEFRPFYTSRHPREQATLWRQSRSTEVINAEIGKLQAAGAPFLADVLASVPPAHGRWATNCLPGQSWHQWGLAVDCFAVVNGAADWNDMRLYQAYAAAAEGRGLTAGIRFHQTDPVHIQMPADGAPRMAWAEIDAEMQRIWGGA